MFIFHLFFILASLSSINCTREFYNVGVIHKRGKPLEKKGAYKNLIYYDLMFDEGKDVDVVTTEIFFKYTDYTKPDKLASPFTSDVSENLTEIKSGLPNLKDIKVSRTIDSYEFKAMFIDSNFNFPLDSTNDLSKLLWIFKGLFIRGMADSHNGFWLHRILDTSGGPAELYAYIQRVLERKYEPSVSIEEGMFRYYCIDVEDFKETFEESIATIYKYFIEAERFKPIQNGHVEYYPMWLYRNLGDYDNYDPALHVTSEWGNDSSDEEKKGKCVFL